MHMRHLTLTPLIWCWLLIYKNIGWNLSDQSSNVRLENIKALIQLSDAIPALSSELHTNTKSTNTTSQPNIIMSKHHTEVFGLFIERFLDRMIQIACQDIDTVIQTEMFILLQILLEKGMCMCIYATKHYIKMCI